MVSNWCGNDPPFIAPGVYLDSDYFSYGLEAGGFVNFKLGANATEGADSRIGVFTGLGLTFDFEKDDWGGKNIGIGPTADFGFQISGAYIKASYMLNLLPGYRNVIGMGFGFSWW
jgi:hypothetical protein